MAYQALYRKYRPQKFSDVVGQDAIVNTLKNSINLNKISHAFLFAGPRGTGKTSVAKIFAKAVNCENLIDGEPCNECENCLAANAGAMNDLIEIDAASNNGVDEIRDIRSKARYAPTQGRYKVYIIDEVHMLSMGAFNALLKTLEEPPAHVIFILATTELQKVPATIISRTQKYTFKRIQASAIIKRLTEILNLEEIKFEPKALQVIAKVADGGMRDALSILDQIISFENNTVTYQDALEITGFAMQEQIEALFIELVKQETDQALTLMQELFENGANPENILNELVELGIATTLALKSAQATTTEFFTDDFLEKLEQPDSGTILNLIELANQALNSLKLTTQQVVILEIFVVKATRTNANQPISQQGSGQDSAELNALRAELQQLQQQVKQLQQAPVATKATAKPKPATKSKNNTLSQQQQVALENVLKTASKPDLTFLNDLWPDLISSLEVSKREMMNVSEPVAASGEAAVIAFDYPLWFERAVNDQELQDYLQQQLAILAKKDIKLLMVPKEEWPKIRARYVREHKAELTKKKNNDKDEATPAAPVADNAIIETARQLFGDEMIEIKD